MVWGRWRQNQTWASLSCRFRCANAKNVRLLSICATLAPLFKEVAHTPQVTKPSAVAARDAAAQATQDVVAAITAMDGQNRASVNATTSNIQAGGLGEAGTCPSFGGNALLMIGLAVSDNCTKAHANSWLMVAPSLMRTR